jgi:hypothetical protein
METETVPTGFHPVAACAFAAGMGVLLAATAGSAERLSIDCLMDDLVTVADDTLAEAQQSVARIFEPLAVQIVWFDTASALRRQKALAGQAAQRAFVTSLYVVRLVAQGGDSGMTPSERSLGSAAVGTRVAIVPYSRVVELARGGNATSGLVLGHVIAHELGHLLLQRATHSAAGLMQATLDLRLAQQGRLLFTAPEAQAIRAAIARDAGRR